MPNGNLKVRETGDFEWFFEFLTLIEVGEGPQNNACHQAFLAVLLTLAVLWSLGRTTYQVDVRLVSTRVTVGEVALGEVTLTNPT